MSTARRSGSAHQKPGEAPAESFPEYDLRDGDEIRLGKTVFRVSILVPLLCCNCSTELPECDRQASPSGTMLCLCAACRQKMVQPPPPLPRRTIAENVKLCAKCKRDVSAEPGANREGEYICPACRSDPFALVRGLLRQAGAANKGLAAIEGYQVLGELGRGGMGAVYLARHEQTGQEVSLKVMLPRVAASARAADDFLRETVNTKVLQHPNVVRLWDAGCSQGTFFLTLEYCGGGSVEKLRRQRGGKLPIAEAGPIILQALRGLEYAHSVEIPEVRLNDGSLGSGRGLVHRDLKPANIFLAAAGRARVAKLGDYGLSKAFDLAGLSGHTVIGDVAGTPQFMPRQQVLYFREVRPEVDVWAMAASLYTLLTGCVPRDFRQERDVWQTVLQTDAVPIRRRNPAIPKRLAQVIDHALVDRPEIGFESAAELKRALETAMG